MYLKSLPFLLLLTTLVLCMTHSALFSKNYYQSQLLFEALDREIFAHYSCVSLYSVGQIPFPLQVISVPFSIQQLESELHQKAISNAKKLLYESCRLHVFSFDNSWGLTQAVKFLLDAVSSSSVNRRGTFIFLDNRYGSRIEKLIIDPVISRLRTVLYMKREQNRVPSPISHYRIYKTRYNEQPTVYSWNGTHFTEPQAYASYFPGHVVPNKTITVCMFEFPPSIIINQKEPDPVLRYSGHDALMIRTFAERAQLDLKIAESKDNNKWGHQLPNGSWVGLMGEVIARRVDIGVADLFMIPERLQVIDMTYPYDISCTTFLTPPPLPVPRWKALVQPFSSTAWIVSLISVLFASLSIWLLANVYFWVLGQSPGPFYQQPGLAAFYTVQMLTGCPSLDDRSRWPLRIYISFAWTFFFLITLSYRASLTAFLSIPVNNPPLDSLKGLANSGLAWGCWGDVLPYFSESVDPNARELAKRYHSITNENNVDIERVANGTFAFFETKVWNDFIRSTMYLDKYGRPTLHTMKECHITFPISIALQQHSPLLEPLNTYLLRLHETGLLTMWKQTAVIESKNMATEHHTYYNNEQEDDIVLTLYKLQGLFIVWGIGVLVSLLSFAIELSVSCRFFAKRLLFEG